MPSTKAVGFFYGKKFDTSRGGSSIKETKKCGNCSVIFVTKSALCTLCWYLQIFSERTCHETKCLLWNKITKRKKICFTYGHHAEHSCKLRIPLFFFMFNSSSSSFFFFHIILFSKSTFVCLYDTMLQLHQRELLSWLTPLSII